MKAVQINATCGIGSTGKICVGISKLMSAENIENYILYSSKTNGDLHGISCSNDIYIKFQALKSRIRGNYGFNSKIATRKMINELERINPDIVHLHNIHGHDCNLDLLFTYFKQNKTKLLWTFHDCWVFTGYCPHFTMAKCDQWQVHCSSCVQRETFSFFFDKSRELFEKKKSLFAGLDLTIITPSQWLADMVQRSFLKEYQIKIINNGIDLETFNPIKNDFRDRYGCENKIIVLGVAFDWGPRKGLDVFIHLAESLGEEYQIVLVGTNDDLDKRLPRNIVSIHKTNNQHELAEIYSAADIFVNPTREDNFPTVNIEALACGTPVITFKTGGSPEIIDDTCGLVVPCDNVESLKQAIRKVSAKKPFTSEACIERAKKFDERERYKEYISLYRECVQKHAAR